MGKTGKWFKSFLTSKKDQKSACIKNDQKNCGDHQNSTTPAVVPRPTTPKEKKRWSFRRSSATAVQNPADAITAAPPPIPESYQEKHSLEAAAATEAATDAALETAQAAAGVIYLTSFSDATATAVEEAAAIKIQSVYRSYLARKALKALRGLVKLQALVRGHMVRKQATATLRCMQALITAQAKARAQRIRSEDGKTYNHRHSTHRRHNQEKIKQSYHDMEENVKIVEMDHGEFRSNGNSRNSYSVSSQQQHNGDRMDNRMSTYYSPQQGFSRQDFQHISPATSAITDISPRNISGHFEDYSFATAQSSPQCLSAMPNLDPSRTPFSFPKPDFAETMSYDHPLYPNYMANTESSRAKARSQSAPKQRPEFERQPSRGRRPSVEGRGIPKGARMQRSSSQVSSAAQSYQYPWSVKLDKSSVSLRDSECGSTCSVLTNANYCRSVVSYDPRY